MSFFSSSPSLNPSNPNRIFWSHEETLTLIKTYKHKWISLNRGNLRAADWGAVAAAVSARASTPKTTSQCRHKIEKLRRKFKSERQQPYNGSRWIYFKVMDRLENPNSNSDNDDDDDGTDYLNDNYSQELKIPMAVPIYSVGSSISNPNYGCQENDDEEDDDDDVDDGEEDEEIELRKKVKDNIPMGVPIHANASSQYRVEEDGDIELRKKVKGNVYMGVPISSNGNPGPNGRNQGGEKDDGKIPMVVPISSVGNFNGNYENQESDGEEIELRKNLRFKIPTAVMPSFMNQNPNVRPNQGVPGRRHDHPNWYREFNDDVNYGGDDVRIRNPSLNAKFIPLAVPISARGNSNPNRYQESNGVGNNYSGDAQFKTPNSLRSEVPTRKPSPSVNMNSSFNSNDDVKPQFITPNSLQSSSLAIPIVNANTNHNLNPNFSSELVKRKRGEKEGNLMTEVARELWKFGDEYIKMEKMKMEMAREMERERMDMEVKKTKMIIDSQKRIMDCFLKAFENDKMEQNPANSSKKV